MKSNSGGVAYFLHGSCSFLLQDFYQQQLAENLMMHLLVEDVHAWDDAIREKRITEKYGVLLSDVVEQPWGMLEFALHDPSGVLWRIAKSTQGA